jgi:electron transport complex protein RnfG
VKTLFVVGGRLAIICTTAALILALVNALTEPVIVENKRRALEEGLLAISAQAPQGGLRLADPLPEDMVPAEYEGLIGVYPLTSSDGNVEGYVVRLVGVGYGGELNLLAGYQTDGTLFAARLMENQETPGLGKKAEN